MVVHNRTSNILTAGEVARLLHVHINTVRRWSDSGIIGSHRIGTRGDRVFSWQDVERLLEEGKTDGGKSPT